MGVEADTSPKAAQGATPILQGNPAVARRALTGTRTSVSTGIPNGEQSNTDPELRAALQKIEALRAELSEAQAQRAEAEAQRRRAEQETEGLRAQLAALASEGRPIPSPIPPMPPVAAASPPAQDASAPKGSRPSLEIPYQTALSDPRSVRSGTGSDAPDRRTSGEEQRRGSIPGALSTATPKSAAINSPPHGPSGSPKSPSGRSPRAGASPKSSASSPRARRNTHTAGQTPPGRAVGWREQRDVERRRVISARACVVCGRDDRPGEQRAKGFKCTQCVGLPSNPHFVRDVENQQEMTKGVDEQGAFVVNDYSIIKPLGEGAFGKVRLAKHNKTGVQYAVKCLSKERLTAKQGGNRHRRSRDPLKPVRDEVGLMKRLSHPNIVQIFGTMESQNEMMIVMEFLPGGQIYPTKLPAAPVPIPRLKRQTCGIARGLDYLHDNGIIHRDIKPENILLDKYGNVKLVDFGVSTKIPDDSDSGRVWGFIGTPAFMPPEAFKGASMEGEGTDVWAFGVTMYAMAFGHLPWPPDVRGLDALGEAIRTQPLHFTHECTELNDALSMMLEREPSKRCSVGRILSHPFLTDVRIRKRHPVEEKEVNLVWDGVAERVQLRAPRLSSGGLVVMETLPVGATPPVRPAPSPHRACASPVSPEFPALDQPRIGSGASLPGLVDQFCKECVGGGCAACGRDGPALVRSFFHHSKGPFVIIPGNSYELNIVDKGRDPRSRSRMVKFNDTERDTSHPGTPVDKSLRRSLIERKDWTDEDFDRALQQQSAGTALSNSETMQTTPAA